MNDDELGPSDGGWADVATVSALTGVPIDAMNEEWQRQGCPDRWVLPAKWSRTLMRRVHEAAAHTGVYDVDVALAWHRTQKQDASVRVSA